jgi:hypothetical protein
LRARSRFKKIRALIERRAPAIDLKVGAEKRLLWNSRQGGGNFLLLFRRRRANVQHVQLDLRLGRLLRACQMGQADTKQNYEDVSEHVGILNEECENLKPGTRPAGVRLRSLADHERRTTNHYPR